LSLYRGVPKTFEDGGLEVGERVCVFGHTDVHEDTTRSVSIGPSTHGGRNAYPAQIFQSFR
jgi:hypothetical protein